MDDESRWGPWIQHCGTRNPSFDREMQVEIPTGERWLIPVGGLITSVSGGETYDGPTYRSSFVWAGYGPCIPVVRYRYRRLQALADLIALAENPPAIEEPAHADAA